MNYTDWSKQPLEYDFNRVFSLISVIYSLSIMFDFCLTFITFRLSPDAFFMYEVSFVIKGALGGNALFCMLVIIIVDLGRVILLFPVSNFLS